MNIYSILVNNIQSPFFAQKVDKHINSLVILYFDPIRYKNGTVGYGKNIYLKSYLIQPKKYLAKIVRGKYLGTYLTCLPKT